MKNPLRSVGKLFTKGGNTVKNTASSIFSKHNMDVFRNHLQSTLQTQGTVLTTVGKITSGIALNPITLGALSFVAPELLPVALGIGAAGVAIGGIGMAETAGSRLLQPKIYKGNDKLQTTGAVVNQIEKAGKGGAQVAKFA